MLRKIILCLGFILLFFTVDVRANDLFDTIYPSGAMPSREIDKPKTLINNSEPPSNLTKNTLPALPSSEIGLIRNVKVNNNRKLIALTYDLCELNTTTQGFDVALVEILRQNKVPATFFLSGKYMRSHEDRVLELMATEYFELGNHAWTHGNFAIMPKEMAKEQALYTQGEYERLYAKLKDIVISNSYAQELLDKIPTQMSLFRLPYGRCNEENLQLLNELGLQVIQWNVVGEIGSDNAEPSVAHSLVSQMSSGSIILMHANLVPKGTAILTANLIKELSEHGYEFVKVSDLLKAGEPVRIKDGYFTTPGDNLGLDTKFGKFGTGDK